MRLTEQHFTDLADAAWLAKDHGSEELAKRLDIMARKANLEVARAHTPSSPMGSPTIPRLTWQDMPSVFDLPEGC
jgi:hypothetical protein